MPILDIFNSDAFSVQTLTDAINRMPNQYFRVRELGLFQPVPVPTTSVALEYRDLTLNLIPSRPRGGGRQTVGVPEKRQVRSFVVPHFPHDDFITADDVQDVRRFGSESELDQIGLLVARKQAAISRRMDATEEHLFGSALRGTVIDADGSTIYNYFTEFAITQMNFAFPLNDTAEIIGNWIQSQVVDWYELNMQGETMTGLHALCSSQFFDALTRHPSVRDAYRYFQATQNPLREDLRQGFFFHGITFEKYLGRFNSLNPDNTTTLRRIVPDNECIIFPVGTTDTFRAYYAPSNFISDANMLGRQRYSRLYVDPEDMWVKVHGQMNVLPVVARPHLLGRGTIAP